MSAGEEQQRITDQDYLKELQDQKEQLLEKVQHLKHDLQDWRLKLDTQVQTYKTEIRDLREALHAEVDTLRIEFSDLKAALKQQLELTASMVEQHEIDDNDLIGVGKQSGAEH